MRNTKSDVGILPVRESRRKAPKYDRQVGHIKTSFRGRASGKHKLDWNLGRRGRLMTDEP